MEVKISSAKIAGRVRIPASKSHTIRALIIATLAKGESHILSPLDSSDTRACLQICRSFGAEVTEKADEWIVRGTGGNPKTPEDILDAMNSGTTFYIAASTAALINSWSVLSGDEQIRKRPVEPLLSALNDLGAEAFSTRNNGCAPIAIKGRLKGGKTKIKCPTSQFLTSLLINCPLAQGDAEIEVLELNEKPYVQMTMNWLDSQGIKYNHRNMMRFNIKGGQGYKAFSRSIAGDFSSATFFLCAAAISGSKLTLSGLDMNDPQGDKAVVSMLQGMGCNIDIKDDQVIIEGGDLRGIELDLNNTPDALPALAVTGCFASGTTKIVNVPQARLKETDRIAVMCQELKKMGALIKEQPAGLIIKHSPLKGTRVHGHSDHRVVMALAIAALAASGQTIIDTAESVAITFPTFFNLLESIRK